MVELNWLFFLFMVYICYHVLALLNFLLANFGTFFKVDFLNMFHNHIWNLVFVKTCNDYLKELKSKV